MIHQLKQNFAFLNANPLILGVMLFGSHVTGDATSTSDIDICIVTEIKDAHELYRILAEVWQTVPVARLKYDVRMFQELPLFIQKDVIELGQVIISRDDPTLYEFLYPYRKRWMDQKYRQEMSPEEISTIFD